MHIKCDECDECDERGKMKEIITITNRKGGSGKSTTVRNLGAGLSREGAKVLFVDLDSQANLSRELGASLTEGTALDLFTGESKAKDLIQHTEGGDIIAGDPGLSSVDLHAKEWGITADNLKEELAPLKKMYDYIIIDTPASLGMIVSNSLTASHSVIITVQAERFSLEGIALLQDFITSVRKTTNRRLKVKGILITRYKSRTRLAQDMKASLEQYAKCTGIELYRPIRECTAIQEAQATGKDIFTYSPRSNATEDYTAFVEAIREGAD